MRSPTRPAIAPYFLFVLSGFAALVLEAVFLRQLAWLLGSSAVASSIVLAAFMAGLALGALLFGRLADRVSRPLSLFGILELGAAVSGVCVAWLLGAGRAVFLAPLGAIGSQSVARLAELALAFALLLVPTVLMGGTLPVLGRAVIRRMDSFLGSLGVLYALNTLGAAAGVFAAGFDLFERVGVSRTALVAATVQAAVGAAALFLDRVPIRTPPEPSPPRSGDFHASPRVRTACVVAAAAGGFAVLGYEVLWTRLLTLLMRSFSYSFSLMLSLFLLGLFLGASLLGALRSRIRDPVRTVGWLLVAMGVWVAGSLFWLPGMLSPPSASTFGEFLAKASLRAAVVVIPPTLLSGMALPLAARGFAGSTHDVGRDIGSIFAANTAAAIAGALVTGLVLLPTFGAPTSLALLAVFNAAVGAGILVRGGGLTVWSGVAIALVAASALSLTASSERFVESFLRASRSSENIGELLFFHEGETDTVAIVRREYGFFDPDAKSLITNGVSMSASVKPVWRYMALEGHLPVLMARDPRKALAVGVGTGITLDALVSHVELDSIVAVELSEGVIRGLDHFAAENGGAHNDPRVRLLRGDGRHYLEMTTDTFDLITLEPPPPIVAGSAHLYSLEFYTLCAERLRPGGIVAQWLPLHAQSLESARMATRTFLDAFPHVMLWLPSVRDAVLIGSSEPAGIDLDRLRAAFAEPRTRANLQAAYLETPEALLATYLLDRSAIEKWTADAPAITDERPLMEFFRHQGGNMTDADIATLLEVPQGGWDWVAGLAGQDDLLRAVRTENRALRLYARAAVERNPAAREQAARISRGTEFFLYPFGCATRQREYLEAGKGVSPVEARARLEQCARLREAPAETP